MEEKYTLDEATAILKQQCKSKMVEGSDCPVCSQRVQLYNLKINGIATSDLTRLYKMVGGFAGRYEHVAKFSQDRGGAFAKLAHWGLIESKTNDDTAKRMSGLWCLTQLGKDFVERRARVPQRVYLYNKECKGASKNTVDVIQALGTKFDYSELMGRTIQKNLTLQV